MNALHANLRNNSKLNLKYSVLFIIFSTFLWSALLNGPLRISSNSNITIYYVLQPILLIFILFHERRRIFFIKSITIFIILLYGAFVGLIYGTPVDRLLFQSFKYIQLFTFLGLLSYFKFRYKVFNEYVFDVLKIFFYLITLTALIQLTTGIQIPTVITEDSELWINTVFFIPNDLGLFLAAYSIFLISQSNSRYYTLQVWVFSLAINIRNDAKAALLAMMIVAALYSLLIFKKATWRMKLIFIELFILLSILIFLLFSDAIKFSINTLMNSGYSPLELFLDPFVHIFNLTPYHLGGSIFDRTDALINNIIALKSNYFLGLGQGGSVYTLSLPKFELLTAKSMHNAVGEWVVEFGPIAIFVLFVYFRNVYKFTFRTEQATKDKIAYLGFALASPFLSVSQSAGYISNYPFWLVLFLILSIAHKPMSKHAT